MSSALLQDVLNRFVASNIEELYNIFCRDTPQWSDDDIADIYSLIKDNVLQKDIVYLCLLIAEPQRLNKFLEHAKEVYEFDISDPSTFVDYLVFFNKHWIYKFLEHKDNKLLSDEIRTKIACLNLFQNTCLDQINIPFSKSLIQEINTCYLDDFWVFFVEEIQHVIEIVEFCREKNPAVNENEVFIDATKDSPLEVFSRYIQLENVSYEDMRAKLSQCPSLLSEDEQKTFLYFEILKNVFVLINNNFIQDVNFLLEDTKEKILLIEDKKIQLEVLENIFGCLFLRENNTFKCKEKELRAILFLLKSALVTLEANEVKTKSLYEKREKLYNLKKLVADAQWRLELIAKLGPKEKYRQNFLTYMLAPPESLIYLCLKNQDFDGACQVLKIFNLEKSPIGHELDFILKFQDLRANIKKIFKVNLLQKALPTGEIKNLEEQIENEFDEFFHANNSHIINGEHEKFDIIFDLLFSDLTWQGSFQLSQIISKHISKVEHKNPDDYKFVKKLLELVTAITPDVKLNVSEILLDARIPLDVEKYQQNEVFYKNLEELYDNFVTSLESDESGVLNANHASHKILFNLSKLCNDYSGTSGNIKYLQKLFNYLKAFSRILYLEDDHSSLVSQGKNTSYFNLLDKNRADLVGHLLFEKHLNPSEFEKYFGKLKLDFLYHVVSNCFPTINLYYNENVTEDELYPENKVHIPNKDIIEYIQKRNWFLAFLLKEMYSVTDAKMEINKSRISTFLNYLKLPRIQSLKIAFENNAILTAVQNNYFGFHKEVEYINSQICSFDILSSGNSSPSDKSSSIEFAQELLEEDFSILDTYALCNIFDTALENQLKNVIDLRDKVILKTIQEHSFEDQDFRLIQHIKNPAKRIDMILENVGKWPLEVSWRCIKTEISRFDRVCDEEQLAKMKIWLRKIEHYKKIMPVLEVESWFESYKLAMDQPEAIFRKLISTEEIDFLIEFIELHSLNEEILETATTEDIQHLCDIKTDYEIIKKLLNFLPKPHVIEICLQLINMSRNLDQLQFLSDYLKELFGDNEKEKDRLLCLNISIKILNVIPQNEYDKQLFAFLWDPLTIFEVLLMNTKLESAKIVLEKVKGDIPEKADQISIEKLDALVRNYAEKSLDFRIVTQPIQKKLTASDCTLMQSMDSLIEEAVNKKFIMPDTVPTKEEWVSDNQVTECMCCSNVTFSMFNRRHHCRRCGRVVCYACARKRMLVPTYGDVLVKVCSDCYNQSTANTSLVDLDESISTRSLMTEHWMLTNVAEHDRIVREEFFYEHTPSVYLCLSIMKLHSVSLEYSRFLLRSCESMLELLNSREDAALQEVDYLLVVKMLKLLAVAIKMAAQECHLANETSLANKILAQADLLGLLANRGCLPLLPVSKESPYIDGIALRKLRDKLLEREQWNLALEVSTKAGLDTTGVFVAWGKSCLKAGSLLLAREKFAKCLEKSREHRESVSELDSSTDSATRRRNVSFSENPRSNKNPPLLDDIVRILETKTEYIDREVLLSFSPEKKVSVFSQPDNPMCILSKLKNLQNIANGKYQIEKPERSQTTNKPTLDAAIYDECVYYLSKYGSPLSTAEFHIKHGYFDKALAHIIQANLGPEVFVEIYMRCLKEGVVEILQAQMSKMDSTLRLWKDYLTHLCFHLEKQRMLNCLYHLQLFMGDYMRAAVSCIRFYEEGSQCFADFHKKEQFLNSAEKHLIEVLEQDQWVDVTTESGGRFEEKSIVNPDLVMKIDKKDVFKHLKTIKIQAVLVKFLTDCESVKGVKSPMEILGEMLYPEASTRPKKIKVPTLFGSITERRYLAVLCILSGNNLKNGFDIALRIAEDFKIKPMTIYNESGKILAQTERYADIAELVTCIKRSDPNSHLVVDMCDEMLTLAVATLNKTNVSGSDVENLIRLIDDKASKISAYIEAKQLKTAYFLAVKYKRTSDIRRILREAEIWNQPSIKALCTRFLQNS